MDGEDIISNITRIEEDPFGEFSKENMSTYSNDMTYESPRENNVLRYIEVIMIILNLLTCLCAIAANIFIIVIICKFKYLQTRTNFYILNYSILNIIYFFIAPICFIVLNYFVYDSSYLFCLFMQSEHTVHSLCLLVIFGLAMDWFVKAIKLEIVKRYHSIYKLVFLIMYIIGSIQLLTLGSMCFVYYDYHYHSILPSYVGIIYLVVSISVIVMYIVKRKTKSITNNGSKKEEYSILIAGIILLTWLPVFSFHIIHHYLSPHYNYHYYGVIIFQEILILIVFGSPIFVVYMLGRLNRNFKMAYDTCFKRSVRKYQHEDMDGDDMPDNEDNDNDVNKVSYACDTESAIVLPI